MNRSLTILITQGDPAGIGPEVALAAANEWMRPDDCRLVIVGFPSHLKPYAKAGSVKFVALSEILRGAGPGLHFADLGDPELDRPVTPGNGSVGGGRAAVRCIEVAIDAALAGDVDAICTAPINKENLAQAGYSYPGHTEMLAERSNAVSFAMMLAGGGLRVVLATIHEPLARVPQLVTREKLIGLLRLTAGSMPDFGFDHPRIGVAGLNPHAGEGGRFGREEIEVIAPAIKAVREKGIDATGPHSADTLFHRMREGEFDVILAMYHDQALIPVKTLDFHGGVNITLGLPFVRTSPDHGTAYDIAGKGIAHTGSFIAALDTAYRLASRRSERTRTAAPAK